MVLPKLVHMLTVLPSPGHEFIKSLNEILSCFIWNHKKGKVNRNILAQDFELGGLKLTHLVTQIKALKSRWIKYLLLENEEWTNIIFQAISGWKDCCRILNLDPISIRKKASLMNNTFWKEVLQSWADIVSADKSEKITTILNFGIWDAWYIDNPNLVRLGTVLHNAGW